MGLYHVYHYLEYFTRIRNFTWRVFDCEELVGVTHMRRWGGHVVKKNLETHPKLSQHDKRVIVHLNFNNFQEIFLINLGGTKVAHF